MIERIDAGEITLQKAAEELGIRPRDFRRWRHQLEYYGDVAVRSKKTFPTLVKRKIVRQIEAGDLTLKEAAIQCNLPNPDTIKYWIKQYGSGTLLKSAQETMKEQTANRPEQLQDQDIQTLKQELDNARLKIALLETLIDLADQEFKTDIRKKDGAKQ